MKVCAAPPQPIGLGGVDAECGSVLRHSVSEALVFGVSPSKILAFGKGIFSQTRYRF
jgi:hypothetical protein